jgi:hypothetical protein
MRERFPYFYQIVKDKKKRKVVASRKVRHSETH